MIEFETVYCDHTALVSCQECFAVIRASDKEIHVGWHTKIEREIRSARDLPQLFGRL